MDWYVAVVLAAFAVTSVWVFVRVNRLYRLVDAEAWPGTRTRRRLSRQMIWAVGWWQITIGALILVSPGIQGVGTSGISVMMVGIGMIGLAALWRRLSLP